VSCSLGGGRGLCLGLTGALAQVPPDLHSAFRPATWSPFVVAVDPVSTSAGGPMSFRLLTTGCSAAGWGRVSVLQLWADWALLP
jgi:hypothetical protein